VVHAVLQKALVHALHVLVDRAHLGRPDEFRREPQPAVLIPLAQVFDILDRVLLNLLHVVCVQIHLHFFLGFVVAHLVVVVAGVASLTRFGA
jgi:hypothetical protein